MSTPMTLQHLEALRPGSNRAATAGMLGVLGLFLHLPTRRLRFEVEGWEKLPDGPTVMVANHTHWLDWIALRWTGWWRGRPMCNWVKPRTYEEGYGRFLDLTGNIPVVSRGYLLAADVRAVHGRPPDEAEYRALRDHLDMGTPLPEGPVYDRLQSEARDILGLRFDPATQTWREAIEALFHAMMEATLAHTAGLCESGADLQIMPQGVTAMRLTQGHPGALQAALALGLPIAPVGINGFPQAYGERGRIVPQQGGRVLVRVGEVYTPEPIAGHTPFLPASEHAHRDALAAGTAAMMARVEALLEPEHRPTEGEDKTDFEGVARFV